LFSRDQYQILSREGKIAFWVNAYTGWLLRVLTELPPGRATLPRFSSPFSNYKLVVLGGSHSLLEMQEEMWAEFKDERIFFVLADGTGYGPSFLKVPLETSEVEEVLKERTLQYVRNPSYVSLRKKELMLSAFLRDVKPFLFFNYGGSEIERKKSMGDEDIALINFLYQNAENEETRSALKQLNFKIQYLPADTRLKRA
jgi:hypothetical protein